MLNMTQNRTGSKVSAVYPDFPGFSIPVYNFKLYQEVGKHDIAELRYANQRDFYFKALKTGTPVQVDWSNDKANGRFFGYVHDIAHRSSNALEKFVVVRVIGASFPLKEGGSKIWKNKTAPEIVSEIAKKFKLKPIITDHPLRFSQQSLAGHTYWEKVQELANRIGYVCQVRGTELHFHPIDTMINKSMSAIPILSMDRNQYLGPYSDIVSHTLDVFTPTIGDHFDTDTSTRKEKTVTGIDPISGKYYTSSASPNKVGKNVRKTTKDPLFKEALSTSVTGNKQAAELIAKAQAQLARFSITAEGHGQGDPRIAPYRTVHISGTGDNSDGFWIIKKVVHFVTFDGRYNIDFECMIDGTRSNQPSNVRPSKAEMIPTMDLSQESSTTTGRATYTKLTSQAAMISESDSGFKVTPRRWVGR